MFDFVAVAVATATDEEENEIEEETTEISTQLRSTYFYYRILCASDYRYQWRWWIT